MRKLIKLIIDNRKIALLLVGIALLAGLYSYYMIPKQEAPDLTPPYATITAVYPGASQVDVERLVTKKIENDVAQMNGYEYSISYTNNSVATIVLKMKYGTDPESAWDDLRTRMDDIQEELPPECLPIMLNTDVVKTAGIIIALTGDNYSYDELAAYGDDITKALTNVSGVSRFDVDGKLERQITVEVDYQKLGYFQLSLDDIVQTLKSQNIQIPSGQIVDGDTKVNLNASGLFTSIEDIENIIIGISTENQTVLRLKDIATVKEELEDSSYTFRLNGKPAVLLTGYFEEDENIVLIGRDVDQVIENLKKDLPSDLTFTQVLYQPNDVSNSVENFIVNLLQGILFVIVVVFIGMGFRNAIIVSTAIPLSIMLTFLVMPAVGLKIHQISIAGLIVALGMLVDNAIVVSDAIQNRVDNGERKISACVDGVLEVAMPVLSSTLTTIAAFSPLLMLNSLAGDYVGALPKIVIIALLASYFVALVVTPTMAFIFFKPSKNKNKKGRIKKMFSRSVRMGMKHNILVFLLVIVALTATLGAYSTLPLTLFPKADKNVLYIDLKAEKNIDTSYMESMSEQVEAILMREPEIGDVTSSIGGGLPRFYDTLGVYAKLNDVGQMMFEVDLSKGGRFTNNTMLAEYLQGEINKQLTGGRATVKQLEYAEPIGAPIRIRVKGEKIEDIVPVIDQLEDLVSSVDGTINVETNYQPEAYEYVLNIKKDEASYYGLSAYDIQNEVSIALRGREATIYRGEGKEENIVVKANVQAKEDLMNYRIKSRVTGNKTPLKNVASIDLVSNLPTIIRYDREYDLTVLSDIKSGYDRDSIVAEIEEKMSDLDTRGVTVVFDGENEIIGKYFGNVAIAGGVALFMVFAILMFQFGSYIQPLIILGTIPLSAIGSLIGLYIFKQPISFTALLGMVSLMGIVVNNAIVLIDYINQSIKRGNSVIHACIEANNKRFRPIMLSTITTIIGLIPLAVSESELFKPMSVALMSGLIVSTFLTLIVIPVIYERIYRKKEKA